MIVIYDQDESVASKCATALVQKGYENVFMLSGGLRVAKLKFPFDFFHTETSDNICWNAQDHGSQISKKNRRKWFFDENSQT